MSKTKKKPLRFDSEVFEGVRYGVSDDGLIINAGKCGRLQIDKRNIASLAKELGEIAEVWGRSGE